MIRFASSGVRSSRLGLSCVSDIGAGPGTGASVGDKQTCACARAGGRKNLECNSKREIARSVGIGQGMDRKGRPVDCGSATDCRLRQKSLVDDCLLRKKGVLWTEYRFKSENVSPLLKRSRKKLGKRGGFGGMAERQEMHRSESAACVACFAECAPSQNPSSRTFPSPHQFLHRCPQLQWSFVA